MEAVIASVTLVFGLTSLWRQRATGSASEAIATRWCALILTVLPLAITIAFLGGETTVSPGQPYTEFSVVAEQPEPVVAIVNYERREESYTVEAKRGDVVLELGPFALRPGQRREIPIPVSFDAAAPLMLTLYRSGDQSPYRSLSIR
jgi:hypothetical protein